MFQTLLSKAMLLLCLGMVIFAWLKGGPAERSGALLTAAVAIGVTLFQFLTKRALGPVPYLAGDGIAATGFLLLAIRYPRLWLAAAMILQGAVFITHATMLMEVVPENQVYYYYAAMNVATFLVFVSIIVGTTTTWLHRRRAARQAPLSPPA